jgi:2-polyprenyl-3-methyl-5-hydroxy-6-metoxy-1,4-benzoquinol methylase
MGMEMAMADHRDAWIEKIVSGKTFVDIGGLWGLTNEKVTSAHHAGATDVCMVDIWPPDSEWWLKFRAHCLEKGLGHVREVVTSIDNPNIIQSIGLYDIVHCSGVLYHCPNPFLTIRNLMSLRNLGAPAIYTFARLGRGRRSTMGPFRAFSH